MQAISRTSLSFSCRFIRFCDDVISAAAFQEPVVGHRFDLALPAVRMTARGLRPLFHTLIGSYLYVFRVTLSLGVQHEVLEEARARQARKESRTCNDGLHLGKVTGANSSGGFGVRVGFGG